MDLMAANAKNGDFIIREASTGVFVLSLQEEFKTQHIKITSVDGMYHMKGGKYGSLADFVEHFLSTGFLQKPLGHKQRHQQEAEQKYRGKVQPRIMCYFCQQYHGPIHFCNANQCFMHHDHFNMIMIKGPN